MKFIHSIKFKFTLWYLVVLAIALVPFSAAAYFYLGHTLYQNLDDSLELRATQLSNLRTIGAALAEEFREAQIPDIQERLETVAAEQFEEEIGEVIYFYFRLGDELLYISPSKMFIPANMEMVEQAIAGQDTFATVNTSEGIELRVYTVPFPTGPSQFMPPAPDSPAPGSPGSPSSVTSIEPVALVIGRPTEDINQALKRLRHILMIGVPLTLIAAGGGGIFLSRRALKPVDEITEKARSIEETDLGQRINVKTKDELGRLATTLNDMIERLEKAFGRQKQFTSDASHELRAPLAIIEAESTLALQKNRAARDYRQSLETISQEAHRMSHTVNQLLTLARADSGKEKLTFGEVNLSELITRLGSDLEALCQDKGLSYQSEQLENLVVKGDPMKLRQVLLNILDNAIKYTPRGGRISASVRAEGELAVVSISDTGVGISPEDLPHIFDRFYRVDKARSPSEGGTGLGLAIAKYITELHGGNIEAESQTDTGSTFRVRLPLYRDA